MIPTSHPSSFVANARTGVGRGWDKTTVVRPAPEKISAASRANSFEPCRASRPITTDVRPRAFIYATIPAAVLATTALFIPEGPGRTGPRRPAVPNSRKPLKDVFSSCSLLVSTQF